ncbi:DUF423 domain-containing protein [Glaciecola siphonariae]|uniref:DUF423 domain-containing protein n=1 Tax=Glaciecola siphonariae TaxID=521012 RepID=A0ABV9LST3_9ALTE
MSKTLHAASNNSTALANARFALITGAAFCLLSVMIGAFAAHGLKAVLSEYHLSVVETGARYQMYHGIALILIGVLQLSLPNMASRFVAMCFTLGIVCFSGSLYLLASGGFSFVAFITPLGGLMLLLGWGGFIFQVYKHTKAAKGLNSETCNDA